MNLMKPKIVPDKNSFFYLVTKKEWFEKNFEIIFEEHHTREEWDDFWSHVDKRSAEQEDTEGAGPSGLPDSGGEAVCGRDQLGQDESSIGEDHAGWKETVHDACGDQSPATGKAKWWEDQEAGRDAVDPER